MLTEAVTLSAGLLDGFPRLNACLQRMYARSTAPQQMAEAFASVQSQ